MRNNDPREMSAKFSSKCSKCGKPINKGESIIYWPYNRTADHYKCSETDWQRFKESVQDEYFYNSQY